MGTPIRVNEINLHEFAIDSRSMLFHIPSSALFEADALTRSILDALREEPGADETTLLNRLAGRFDASDIQTALSELRQLDLIDGGSAVKPATPGTISSIPLNTVVLNINTGCNLSCTYCYKEDLTTPALGQKMDFKTAAASVDMLLRESPEQSRYNVVFFGGEPLTNLPLIKQLIEYAETTFAKSGKRVDFSLTTNATLLDDETIDYLNAHRVGIAVSIDGPAAIHDRNRITVGGKGTYATVERKVKRLLERYNSRPVGARVTLTTGSTDIHAIWDHLINQLGFAEVGFAPVTAGDLAEFNLSESELEQVFANMKALGDHYLEEALQGRNIGFSNLHQLLSDLHEGTRKSLPCGAGYSMLAVDKDGDLNLCHRFTGSDLPRMGNVNSGVDYYEVNNLLQKRVDRSNTGCDSCRIRNLCSGGCYHESYQRFGDPAHPVYHYCELMRDWVDHGLSIYARILAENPDFFETQLAPRRGSR